MHYANGRAARIGDIVRGKGYNIKHEIIGVLIEAHPESTECNCQVACVSQESGFFVRGWKNSAGSGFDFQRKLEPGEGTNIPVGLTMINRSNLLVSEVRATIEYGQLDAFVALDPKNGEILPAETPA